MTKHTPGPWVVGLKTGMYKPDIPDGEYYTPEQRKLLLKPFEALSVGTPNNQVAIIPLDESSAINAALIASAPEMAQLLKIASEILRNIAHVKQSSVGIAVCDRIDLTLRQNGTIQ